MESTQSQHTQNDNGTYKLTLSSHPGKALVMMERVDQKRNAEGIHDVNWFGLGDASKALEVTLKYDEGGHCFIMYESFGE